MERPAEFQGQKGIYNHDPSTTKTITIVVTTADSDEQPVKPDLEPLEGFWAKEEEHFVAPVSPLFFSIHQKNIRDATRAAFADFGFLIDHLELTYRAGEIYERKVSVGGDDGAPPPWWVLGAMARTIPSLRKRMKQAKHAVRTDLEAQIFQQWDTEWKPEMAGTTAQLREVEPSALTDSELAAHLRAIREFTHRALYVHFQIGIANLFPIYRLVRLCEELFDWNEHQTMQLLHGSSIGSSVGSRDLDRIASLIDQDLEARETLLDDSTDFAHFESHHPDIAAEIRTHLQTYGYRMIQNDPMSPTFLEVPSVTLQLLRDRLRNQLHTPDEHVSDTRSRAEASAYELLTFRSSSDRARFQHTVQRARLGYGLREENVYLTLGHPFALLRFALLEAGERLHQAGHLARSTDVFYGTFDEIHQAMNDGGSPDLGEVARRRRLECQWTLQNPGPRSFGTPAPDPDIRGLPREARELHEAALWATARMRAPVTSGTVELRGIPASPGQYRGRARVIRSEQDFHRLRTGDVLVCPSTSSSWAVLFGTCAALVTDQGGSLSHPAIIAREHGIPAVVATVKATQEIRDGQTILIDGTNGRIELLDEQGNGGGCS